VAIRTAAQSGFLMGVKEARKRLGWSLNESVDAVNELCYPPPEEHAKLKDFQRFVAEQYAQQAGRHPPWSNR
jgi:hypothetical protein